MPELILLWGLIVALVWCRRGRSDALAALCLVLILLILVYIPS